jgi:hypothetical protein
VVQGGQTLAVLLPSMLQTVAHQSKVVLHDASISIQILMNRQNDQHSSGKSLSCAALTKGSGGS